MDLCVRVPASIKRHLICLRHALVDLSGIDDEALSQQARLRTFLKALKYIRRRDLLLHLDTVLADIRALSPVDRRRLFLYIEKAQARVKTGHLRASLRRVAPELAEKIMGHLTEPFFKKGRAKGRAEGRAEARAEALLQVLETRFGTLPVALRKRIAAADEAALAAWFGQAIRGASLESIFGASSAS